eukprot:5099990-Amphidinium_carterae.1
MGKCGMFFRLNVASREAFKTTHAGWTLPHKAKCVTYQVKHLREAGLQTKAALSMKLVISIFAFATSFLSAWNVQATEGSPREVEPVPEERSMQILPQGCRHRIRPRIRKVLGHKIAPPPPPQSSKTTQTKMR